jgi:hypothetical protein
LEQQEIVKAAYDLKKLLCIADLTPVGIICAMTKNTFPVRPQNATTVAIYTSCGQLQHRESRRTSGLLKTAAPLVV